MASRAPKIKKDNDQVEASDKDKFIFELIKDRYDYENSRSDNLNTRSSNLIGWIGLIISILTGITGLIFTDTTSSSSQSIIIQKITVSEVYLLISIVSVLVGSLFFSLLAFRLRKYQIVSEPPGSIIAEYFDKSHTYTLRQIASSMANATNNNKNENDKKADLITISWILFLVGMLIASVFLTSYSLRFLEAANPIEIKWTRALLNHMTN